MRKSYKLPGWYEQPTDWFYSVGFKKRKSGRLRWVLTGKKDVAKASKAAREYIEIRHPNKGYREYGVSKTYVTKWAQYQELITEEEYKYAKQWQLANKR